MNKTVRYVMQYIVLELCQLAVLLRDQTNTLPYTDTQLHFIKSSKYLKNSVRTSQ